VIVLLNKKLCILNSGGQG